MYRTTGFGHDKVVDLCVILDSAEHNVNAPKWPPCLSLFKSVAAALTYMRHNRTQAGISESFGVSHPTISHAITVITPLFSTVLTEYIPTPNDLDQEAQYIRGRHPAALLVIGRHKELFSGKHKTSRMNVQVASSIYGDLTWISDPVNGSRHDHYCLRESDVLRTLDPRNWIGDQGYISNLIITPFRKPEGRKLFDSQKEFNIQVNKIRSMIEQVISHFKNWTIMHTDSRRPLNTFTTTISAVISLHFYRTA